MGKKKLAITGKKCKSYTSLVFQDATATVSSCFYLHSICIQMYIFITYKALQRLQK